MGKTSRRPGRNIQVIVLPAIGLAVGLAAVEALIRMIRPAPANGCGITYVQHEGYHTYPPLSELRCRDERGADVRASTDEHGLRNAKGTLEPSQVMLLGDSFISAVLTSEDRTLAAHLRRQGFRVYNAGMDGFSTFQEAALLQELLQRSEPRIVVVGFYLGNDFRDNYFGRSPAVGQPNRYAPSLKARLLQGCHLSVVCDALYTRLYLGVARGHSRDPMASYSLSELQSLRLTYEGAMAHAVQRTGEALDVLQELCEGRGCSLYLVGIPSKAQVYRSFHEISGFADDPRSKAAAQATLEAGYSFDRPNDVLESLARERKMFYVSLLPAFRNAISKPIYGQIDVHWTEDGQQLAADRLIHTVFKYAKRQ